MTIEQDRPRPNCFVVGAPKCGTTFWVETLQRHPEVFFCDPKEPNYFSTDLPASRWVHTLEDYEAMFSRADHRIVGDGSVRHLMSRDAARNIAAYNPSARILIFIRKRADFIRAYHNQLTLNVEEHETDLRRAWELSRFAATRPVRTQRVDRAALDYRAAGRFRPQIERFIDNFPASQIRVLDMSDWRRAVPETSLAIQAFLGVTPRDLGPFRPINEALHPRSRWLHRLSERPPAPLLAAVRWLARRVGAPEGLGLGRALKRINLTRGYEADVSASMHAVLSDYFAEDELETFKLTTEYNILLRPTHAPRE